MCIRDRPYYEGITLRKWLADLGTTPSEKWLRQLAEPMMDALAALHAERCFHRDVAPDNILMLYDRNATGQGGNYLEQKPRPVLLDFGAARRVIGDATQQLTAILKSGYSPVEQYEGELSLRQGAWTDVYALCAVLYTAAVGKAPGSSIARVVRDDLVPARVAAKGRYSDVFLAAIDAGLAVRPEQRPQTMQHGTGPRVHRCAEVGRKRKERARDSLDSGVAGEKHVVRDPARRDDLRAQHRQHDVAAAKHQSARSIERVKNRQQRRVERARAQRQRQQEPHKQRQRSRRGRVSLRRTRLCIALALGLTVEPDAKRRTRSDDEELKRRTLEHRKRGGRRETQRESRAIGAQRPRHAPHGLRDDGDGSDLEPVQPSRGAKVTDARDTDRKRDHRQRRRQREAHGRQQCARDPGALHTERKDELAARGPR